MIEISTGKQLQQLIDRATARPDHFADIALCAPFIDDRMLPQLVRLAIVSRRAGCGLRIVTSKRSAAALAANLPGPAARWRRLVVANDRVHAKAYLLTPRGRGYVEAIVTSANLTWGGIAGNIELGVAANSASPQGRRIVRAVREFIGRVGA